MTFKTLMLQLYKPSKHKRDLIDAALLRYAQALQFLLDRYCGEIEELAESETCVTQQRILKMIGKETTKDLNGFGVQPFKDSLKIEFAAVAASYIARKRQDSKTGYPLAFLDDSRYRSAIGDCIRQFDGAQIGRRNLENRCSRLIRQTGKLRSLYFGRYAVNREYCLLYDEFKDRFYAKLYLMNREESIPGGNWTSGLSLKYVRAGTPPLINKPGNKRYLILPLAFGKRQYTDLKEALKDPGALHSARLVKKENHYYLMINIECGLNGAFTAVTTMGISRSALGGLNYTVCGEDGAVSENGRIAEYPDRNLIARLSNRIAEIAEKNRSQVVLEADGCRNDRMPVPQGGESCLSGGQYALLAKRLNYKLPEKGLPPPIEVSANGLFLTCPGCGARTQRNRVSDELFACIRCGYASELEWIGSETLAKKPGRYREDKIPITIRKNENGFLCYNKILGFECELPPGAADYAPMYEKLDRLVKSMDGIFINDPKRYAVWKKLSQAPNPEGAIRLILK